MEMSEDMWSNPSMSSQLSKISASSQLAKRCSNAGWSGPSSSRFGVDDCTSSGSEFVTA
jgi:hypothetical protein